MGDLYVPHGPGSSEYLSGCECDKCGPWGGPQYGRDGKLIEPELAPGGVVNQPAMQVEPSTMTIDPKRIQDIEDRLRRVAFKLGHGDTDAYLLLGDANYLTDVRFSLKG